MLKGGMIAWAQMDDANASIPTPQPQLPRSMFGAHGRVPARTSLHFVTAAALEAGLADRLGVERRLSAVTDVTQLGKAELPENTALPEIRVDPDTLTVTVDGEVWEPEPVRELPLAQWYFLF